MEPQFNHFNAEGKAAGRGMELSAIHLIHKEGGTSGVYGRED